MSIAANSIRTYIFRVATAVTGFMIGILISRILGPSGKGYYSGVFLFFNTFIAVLGTLGPAVTYQVSRLQQSPHKVFVTANVYSGLIGIITIIGFWVFTIINPRFHQPALWLVVAATPFALIVTNVSGLFQGLNRITALNWIGIGAGLFQLALLSLGFFGYYQVTVQTAILFWLCGQLVTVMAALWVCRRYWWPPSKELIQIPILMAMLGFGWQLSLNSIIGILNSRIDSLLVLTILKTKEYGLYSVAINGAEILWYASGAIAIAICAHVGKATSEQAGKLTAKAIRHTLLINIPFAILMESIAWLIPLIYGERFTPALIPFRILLPGVLAYSIAGIYSTYFTIQLGKPKVPLLIAFISFMVDLIASLLLIPRLGMIGGALANTISYVTSISVMTILFCKCTKMSLVELFKITQDDLLDYQMVWEKFRHFLQRGLRRV